MANNRIFPILSLLLLIGLLSGCDALPDWLGEEDSEPPLPGERIAILGAATDLAPDPALEKAEVPISDQVPNTAWPQAGANAASVAGNLVLSPSLSRQQETRIGEDNAWETVSTTAPVIGNKTLYVMDARGYISAHEAMNVDRLLWQSSAAVEKEEQDILGGGLAYNKGKLYATTGFGKIVAIDATSGKKLWEQLLNIPLRAAPRIHGRRLFALSVDNQLFALSATNGNLLWTHRGIHESAGFLAPVVPAASDNIVVAPYSSGTIHGIDAIRGAELWADALSLTRRTDASSVLSGIGGNPVTANGVVFAASNNGFMAASLLRNGRRLWEQNISTGDTPWLAGQYIYVLSPDNLLACLRAIDGATKWTKQLQRYENTEEKTDPLHWSGPIMAGDHLFVTGAHGKMLKISPATGDILQTIDIPDGVLASPIVANGRMYMVTRDATLYVYY